MLLKPSLAVVTQESKPTLKKVNIVRLGKLMLQYIGHAAWIRQTRNKKKL
jgi:hypothetical protein